MSETTIKHYAVAREERAVGQLTTLCAIAIDAWA